MMKRVLLALVLTAFSPLYGASVCFNGMPTFLQNLTFGGPNANPQVAVSANGQAMAVWTNFPNQIEIQASFFNGTSWIPLNHGNVNLGTALTNLGFISPIVRTGPNNSTGTIAFGSAPKVGIDQNGNATIVWVSPNSQIMAARYSGQNLSSVFQLTATGTSNISPTLAVNQQGSAVVVWIQAASYQVLARSFNSAPGGTWGLPFTFMPILPNNLGIPVNPNGTYPASFGLSNTIPGVPSPNTGTMVWLDGPTGIVRAGNFSIP